MERSFEEARDWMILWIIGSFAGWITGLVVNFLLALLSKPVFYGAAYGPLVVFAPFVIFGIFVGLLQWCVALKDIVNGVAWIIATTAATIFILASLVVAQNLQLSERILDALNLSCPPITGCNVDELNKAQIIQFVIFSVVVGLAAAVPTSIVLSRYGSKVYMWVLGSLVASLVGTFLVIPFGLLSESAWLEAYCYFFLIGPVVIAVVSAPFMYIALSEPARLRQ